MLIIGFVGFTRRRRSIYDGQFITLGGKSFSQCCVSSTVLFPALPPLSPVLSPLCVSEQWQQLLRALFVKFRYLYLPAHNILLQNKVLYGSLAETDPEIQNIVEKETWRQLNGLELIASEVCTAIRLLFYLIIPIMTRAELDQQGGNGGQWLHPYQQVL